MRGPKLHDDHLAITFDAAVPLCSLAPGAARAFLADGLNGVPERELESAQLLLSEVLSMSVRHSALPPETPIHFSVLLGPRTLRVAVEDPGWEAVAPPTTAWEGDAADMGFLLLSYLADRWGVEHGHRCPVVWFELDLS